MLFSRKEKGQGMVEYALIIVLVAVVLIIVLALVGSQISNVFSRIISGLGHLRLMPQSKSSYRSPVVRQGFLI